MSSAVAGSRTLVVLRPIDSRWTSSFRHNTTKLIFSRAGDQGERHSLLYQIEDEFSGSYLATRAGSYRLSIVPYTCESRSTV